jgi:hypothetical protein
MRGAVNMAIYNLFISHAWAYDERYAGICRLIDSVPGFTWRDYSAPRDYPVVDRNSDTGRNRLRALLRERVRLSSCFILAAGMYVDHRYWVQAEIEFAREYGKPILGVQRRGQQRTPDTVYQVSDKVVAWNSMSIVNAIRELA